MELDISKIDWKLLRKQKLWLIAKEGMLCAEGLTELLDHIQDSAVASGLSEELIFGAYDPETDEYVVEFNNELEEI